MRPEAREIVAMLDTGAVAYPELARAARYIEKVEGEVAEYEDKLLSTAHKRALAEEALEEIAKMKMSRCNCGHYFAPDAALHVARAALTGRTTDETSDD